MKLRPVLLFCATLVLPAQAMETEDARPLEQQQQDQQKPPEKMAEPTGAEPTQISTPTNQRYVSKETRKALDNEAKKWKKQFGFRPDVKDPEGDIRRMESEPKGSFTPGDFKACNGGRCPMEDAAKECGERLQQTCGPAAFGGRTMCGFAVAKMIECMKTVTGAQPGCTGRCGHGKMFVDCKNGEMKKCGYQPLSPTDNRCKMPGAVLAYTQSPTTRGAIYGHVEFVCGQGQYCSVYKQPKKQPWPRSVANACWYPTKGGVTENATWF